MRYRRNAATISATMSPKEAAFNAAVEALESLQRKHFTNDVKLSFVMHHPTDLDCYMVVASDIEGLEAAVRRAIKAQSEESGR